MALDALFGKKFKLATSDKFDEYMKALGNWFFHLLIYVFLVI